MTVERERAAATLERGSETYYFCSKGCRAEFEAEPKRFTTE
jgi:YHS domain-containing protein